MLGGLLALSTRPQTRGAALRSRVGALACRGVVYVGVGAACGEAGDGCDAGTAPWTRA